MSVNSGTKDIVSISCNQNKALAVYRAELAKILDPITPHIPVLSHMIEEGQKQFTAIDITKNKATLITGDEDGRIQIYDMATGKNVSLMQDYTKPINLLRITSEGKYLISSSSDNEAIIWDMNTRTIKHILKGHTDIIKGICIIKNNRYAVTVSEDKSFCIWEIETGKLVNRLEGHSDWVNTVCCANDDIIVTGSEDRSVKFWKAGWSVNSCECYKTLRITDGVRHIYIVGNGEFLVTAGRKKLMIWHIATEECVKVLNVNTAITSLSVAGEHLLVGYNDNSVMQMEMPSCNNIRVLKEVGSIANRILVTGDGRTIVSAAKAQIQFWNLSDCELSGMLHNITTNAFLWTTPPDSDALSGRFWTNRYDLIKVVNDNKNSDSGEHVTTKDRENYILGLNSQKKVMSKINGHKMMSIKDSDRFFMESPKLIPMQTAC
ncbi:MAG: WD40 repeat domain-containing protein [Desulfamplus sp.]|nr:WD40 repeat domain-containing protein [Desulfamplus sp.]